MRRPLCKANGRNANGGSADAEPPSARS